MYKRQILYHVALFITLHFKVLRCIVQYGCRQVLVLLGAELGQPALFVFVLFAFSLYIVLVAARVA